jgi:predicted nuclease with RNAse H fold
LYVGIDLGQRRIHLVAFDDQLGLAEATVVDVADLPSLRGAFERAEVVAIDAPEALSTAPHANDEALPPKFRTARCAEIALRGDHAISVPWTTPTVAQPLQPWMQVGFDVFELVRSCGTRAIEVFPHAGFRILAGGRIPSKQAAAGLRLRAELLRAAGVDIEALEMWSHDSLDAALAALIAHQAGQGKAVRVGCGHDDSAMWLPSPVGHLA